MHHTDDLSSVIFIPSDLHTAFKHSGATATMKKIWEKLPSERTNIVTKYFNLII